MEAPSKSKLYFLIGATVLVALLFYSHKLKKRRALAPKQIVSQVAKEVKVTNSNLTKPTTHLLLNEKDKKLLKLFDEIVKNKNDNDPKADAELRNLAPPLRKILKERYRNFARENRNARGFVVFLIARELQSKDDLDFIKSIYEEEPCTNLEDCSAAPSENPHPSAIENTSLNYPQLVGLYQIELQISENSSFFSDPENRAGIAEALELAIDFPVDAVQQRAKEVAKKLDKSS